MTLNPDNEKLQIKSPVVKVIRQGYKHSDFPLLQEKIDELITEYGFAAVIEAVKAKALLNAHVHKDEEIEDVTSLLLSALADKGVIYYAQSLDDLLKNK